MIWRLPATIIFGLALAFFVAVSVFADGPGRERVVTIGEILAGYLIAGLIVGYRSSRWYGIGLAVPGLVVLLLYALGGEASWWYLGYAALLIGSANAKRVIGGPPQSR